VLRDAGDRWIEHRDHGAHQAAGIRADLSDERTVISKIARFGSIRLKADATTSASATSGWR
jgi:hypothetical protein